MLTSCWPDGRSFETAIFRDKRIEILQQSDDDDDGGGGDDCIRADFARGRITAM